MAYSIQEAAEALGPVSYTAIRNEIERGRLEAYRVGKRIFIEDEEIEDYKRRNTIEPAPEEERERPYKGVKWKPGAKIKIHGSTAEIVYKE